MFVYACVRAFLRQSIVFVGATLTLYDVSQTLSHQQVSEAGHFLLQLTHQTVAGVLVDHSVTADLFSTISVPGRTKVF